MNEKEEFIKYVLKAMGYNEAYDNNIVGEGFNGEVLKISNELCLKVCENKQLPKIPLSFKKCKSLCIPEKVFLSNSNKYIGTIQKFYNFGSLQLLIKRQKKLPQYQTKKVLFDILIGLNEIHTNGFLHRDFYPGNIMLNKNDKEISAAIIDFDEMQPITSETKACFRYNGYQAPEIVFSNSQYDNKSEMFAFGVIAWELIFGNCPFGGYNFFGKVIEKSWDEYLNNELYYNNEVKNALKSLPLSLFNINKDNNEINELLYLILNPDRGKRISAEQALHHHFFKECYEKTNEKIDKLDKERE